MAARGGGGSGGRLGPRPRFDGTARTGCRGAVRGGHQRGPVCCRRRSCSPVHSGTALGVQAILGGVERGWSLRSTPGDSDRGRTCQERGLACGAARGLGRAVVMKLVVCRSRGRNEFGFIENMCCGF